jgi:hypothetical protein
MSIYGTPLQPGLRLSVNSDAATQVTSPQGFNSAYMLIEQPAVGTLLPNAVNLITSLVDYRNKIGGVPTTVQQLVDYLSVSAFFDNSGGAGLLQVIPVQPPSDISTLTTAFVTAGQGTLVYSLTINGRVISGSVASGATPQNTLASEIARKIEQDAVLKNIVYVRAVNSNSLELAPFVSGTVLSFAFATPAVGSAGQYLVGSAAYNWVQNPPASATPSVVDYGQALYTALKDNLPLGFIIAPGLFYTSTSFEIFKFAELLDVFCRRPQSQHLAYIDVINPDASKIPLYATLGNYTSGQLLASGSKVIFKGDVLTAAGAGLVAVPNAVAAATVAVAARVKLPQAVTFKGVTASVIQSINATAAIAVPATPTALELQKFVPIPDQLIISEALAAETIVITERSSAKEDGLYNWRADFNSIEGHVSVVGPYQKYNGLEVSADFVIPAAVYLAALHIKVADQTGLATPPASDSYPLVSTSGPIWEVTDAGHALLNGNGVNIIKTINAAVYIMGSRTLAKADLYNRINNRVILSAYVRSLTLALNQGVVLRPLNSTGTQLSAIKTTMDRVAEAFYRSNYFDGITSGNAYRNVCSNLNNPPAQLQQGIITAESFVTQIGMSEQLRVTISERLLGT